MRRSLAATLLRGVASPAFTVDGSLSTTLRVIACEQPWIGGLPLRGFASDGEEAAGESETASRDAGEDRRESGSQASTSASAPGGRQPVKTGTITSIAHLRPAASRWQLQQPKAAAADTTAANVGEAGGSQPSSLGRPQTTLEAKKAYRQQQQQQARGRRQQQQQQQQQRVAAEQAAASPTLAARQATRMAARERAAADEEAPWLALLAEKRTTDALTEGDCGKYVAVDLDALPEVFSPDHPDGQDLHPAGGCGGLIEELLANGQGLVMHRACGHALTQACLAGERRRLYLTGPAFSGKSVALAGTVAALRAQGWLVLYVPQALQLTHGGFFSRRTSEGGGPEFDTPECARLMLHYLLEAHPARCEELDAGVASLAQVCREGIAAEEPAAVVDAFLRALQAVITAPKAAVCVDNYQALYLPTEYGEWLSQHKRRVIQPEELRVSTALRLLERPLANAPCLVVAAASRGGGFSPRLRMPLPKDSLFNIPRFSQAEWRAMAAFYRLTGVTDELPEAKVAKAFLLTQGNVREYRRTASSLLDLEGLEGLEAAAA